MPILTDELLLDHMSIPDVAILIACIAFMITQINIERTRRRLEHGTTRSWARADQKIDETREELKSELQRIVQENRPNQPIQELANKINGIPQYLEVRLDKVSANMTDNFVRLQTALDARIEKISSVLPPTGKVLNLGDPTEAQQASVLKRKANEIAGKLDEAALQSTFGGRMALILEALGYTDLKDWMIEHPAVYPILVQEINRRPALKSRMDQLIGASQGGGSPGSISKTSGGYRIQ